MTSLWSSAGVLLWKIWRVKKHESRLNRGRLGKRWLQCAITTRTWKRPYIRLGWIHQ
ncbi:hypothetical protein L914_15967 [Phytophthora nicotianae]|uniref:Uncharacterized protein n=2 Tax=Phytophthora nicotianae TaxID=4792 RepID=V9EE18_PHYNI|nr:hypothetical protein F443_16610 [Phytophthora nicotianae P1569]ETM37485.1 hypothetical protein L914_15967 [Phytophthora nicotianae]